MKKLFKFIIGGTIALSLLLGANGLLNNQNSSKLTENSNITISEFFGIESTYAQSNNPPANNSGNAASGQTGNQSGPKASTPLPDELIKTIGRASTFIDKIFNPLIYFITRHIGEFMTNDYIYSGKMGEMLQSLWVVSRNIVNIAFVIILLFLAAKQVFGGSEGSDLRKTLPMFVVMLVAINFSWLGVRLVLDASNVATNVAFSIPNGVEGVKTIRPNIPSCKIENNKAGPGCQLDRIYYPFDAEQEINVNSDCKALDAKYSAAYPKSGKGIDNDVKGKRYFCWKQLDAASFSKSNAAYQLTYSMARVQNLPKAQTGNSITKVGIGTLFAIVIQLVYLIAFGSLFIALVIRAAALWILVAFSPVIILLYYLSSSLNFSNQNIDNYLSFSALTSWAFAPTKVAVVWSVGFLMITIGQTTNTDILATLNQQGSITSQGFAVNSLFMGMDSLQEVIWLIMTVGIIWIGTFTILKDLKIGGSIFQAIDNYGTSLAKEIATSPKWAPIIPMVDPVTGKLGRTSFDKSGFNVLDNIRNLRLAMSNQEVRTNAQAVQKLKNINTSNSAYRTLLSSRNEREIYNAFRSITSLKNKTLKEKSSVQKILETSGRFKGNEDRLAKAIADFAKSGKTKTVPTPTQTNTNQTNQQSTANTPQVNNPNLQRTGTATKTG